MSDQVGGVDDMSSPDVPSAAPNELHLPSGEPEELPASPHTSDESERSAGATDAAAWPAASGGPGEPSSDLDAAADSPVPVRPDAVEADDMADAPTAQQDPDDADPARPDEEPLRGGPGPDQSETASEVEHDLPTGRLAPSGTAPGECHPAGAGAAPATPVPVSAGRNHGVFRLAERPGRPSVADPLRDRRRRRTLMVVGVVLLVVALVGGGFAGGWVVSQRWSAARTLPETGATVVYVPEGVSGARMPDLRGLSQDDAMQVLADNGWDVAQVSVTTEPFSGPTGMVIEQSPAFGASDVTDIGLVVSEAAVVPVTDGRPATEVTTELRSLGANVALVYAYDPKIKAGQVISIDPAPGEQLPFDVTLTVAESGTALFLAKVPCSSSCLSRSDRLLMNGTTYTSGVTASASDSSTTHVYLLGRHADLFQAEVGVPDDVSDPSVQVTVRFVGDGAELATATASYGKTTPVEISVTGVLRLEIITSVANPGDRSASQKLGLGDARVVGSDQAIAQLSQE